MNTLSRLVVTAAVVGGVGGIRRLSPLAENPRLRASAPVRTIDRPATGGSIVSFVRDHDGKPVAGAVVSVVGRRIATGITDQSGTLHVRRRCLRATTWCGSIEPATSRRAVSSCSPAPGVGTTWSFVLKAAARRRSSSRFRQTMARQVYAAGFVGEEPRCGRTGEAPAGTATTITAKWPGASAT